MKAPRTTLKISATFLAAGTGYEAYVLANKFFGTGVVGVFCATITAIAAIALFDNAGLESFIRVGQHFAKRKNSLGK